MTPRLEVDKQPCASILARLSSQLKVLCLLNLTVSDVMSTPLQALLDTAFDIVRLCNNSHV